MSGSLTDALLSLDGLDGLDAVETLEQAGEIQRNVNLAQAELLKIACHWADLNAVLDNPRASNLPGTERLVRLGGEGTPEIAEFASGELGAQLQMSAGGCAMVIADGLDLRHRLPLLWHLVCLGDVKPYVARQVAQRTRQLDVAAAATVDAKVARYAPTLSWGRLATVVDAAIMAADPERAELETEAARDRQGVWVRRDTDHGYQRVFIRAAGPDIESFDAPKPSASSPAPRPPSSCSRSPPAARTGPTRTTPTPPRAAVRRRRSRSSECDRSGQPSSTSTCRRTQSTAGSGSAGLRDLAR